MTAVIKVDDLPVRGYIPEYTGLFCAADRIVGNFVDDLIAWASVKIEQCFLMLLPKLLPYKS